MVNAIFYQIIKSACRNFISHPPSHLTGETGCFEKLSGFLWRLKEEETTDRERAKSEAICTVRLTCRGANFCGTDPGVDGLILTKPTSFSSQHVSCPSLALRGSIYLARAPLSVIWPRSGPCWDHCMAPLLQRSPLASQNGSPYKHCWLCAPFTLGEVRSSVSRLEQLRPGCELVTSWSEEEGGREEQERKEQRGKGPDCPQCRMTGFTAAWLQLCKHSRKHLIASPRGRSCPTPFVVSLAVIVVP